ncbi:MAG: anhydro-N-acetylmuramic acid kinase, partial [Alphaproteobacteria bacterium]|nr:anhydro-N-acetylmuramic acid kinase [Alphaproteobacteria bacterium]
MKPKIIKALGLMSGTSIDGIDAALIETDGQDHVRSLGVHGRPYTEEFRAKLRKHLGNDQGTKVPAIAAFERELTELHAVIAQELLQKLNE